MAKEKKQLGFGFDELVNGSDKGKRSGRDAKRQPDVNLFLEKPPEKLEEKKSLALSPGAPDLGDDEEGTAGIRKTYSDRNVGIGVLDLVSGDATRKYDTVEYLEQYYRYNDTVRACIDAVAFAASQSGYHFAPTGGKKEVDQKYKILLERFFDDINEEDDADDLLLDTFMDLVTYGDAYWELVVSYKNLVKFAEYLKNPVGDPEKVPLPYKFYKVSAYMMKIKVDPDTGLIEKYEQTDRTGQVLADWQPNRIIHFKIASPIEQLYGVAPSSTLANTIAADIFANDYNGKFFENNATPRLHIDLGNVTKEELDRFCSEAEQKLKGKPHRNLVTRGGVKVDPIGLKNTDMEFGQYQKYLTQKILAMYRVQPIVLGLTDSVKGVTAQAQIAMFKFLAVDPLRRIVASRINKKVIKRLFPGVPMKFKFNPIDRLDLAAQSEVDKSDVSTNIKTVNEVRAERGLPRVDWGDEQVLMPGQKGGRPGKLTKRQQEERDALED
jgi:HK97 family phage portal protein